MPHILCLLLGLLALVSAFPLLDPVGRDGLSDPFLVARADAVSPPGATTGIHVQFDFVGFFDGRATVVKIKALSGLANDTQLAPGSHVHTTPVPPDGNCSATFSRLDPYEVTDGYLCDLAFPAYCEAGDLSGKHGELNGTASGVLDEVEYEDDYLRWFPGEFSLLGRSVVVHVANRTRIACGNITSPLDGTATPLFSPTNASSSFNPPATLPNASFPLPGPPITPINGTVFPNVSYLATLPYPWPNPALSISEALNVNLITAKNVLNETRPAGARSDSPPPFARVWDFCSDDDG